MQFCLKEIKIIIIIIIITIIINSYASVNKH